MSKLLNLVRFLPFLIPVSRGFIRGTKSPFTLKGDGWEKI